LRAWRGSRAAAVVGDLDVDEAPLVVGADPDGRPLGLARAAADLIRLHAVVDGVAHEVQERVGDLLDHCVVHLDGFPGELEVDGLARGARRFAHGRCIAREESADGHHASARHLVAEASCEPVHVGRVLADAPDEPSELGLDLGDVGRDLVDAPREDVEVIVAVELELGEDVRLPLRGSAGNGHRGGKLGVAMLLLEVTHRLRHARAAEREELVHALDLSEALVEPASRDDELAHQIHQRVEAIEADADARATLTARAHRAGLGLRRHEAGHGGRPHEGGAVV